MMGCDSCSSRTKGCRKKGAITQPFLGKPHKQVFYANAQSLQERWEDGNFGGWKNMDRVGITDTW